MPNQNKTRKRKKLSFWKTYHYELTVLGLFSLGLFLLVEKMEIKNPRIGAKIDFLV